MEIVFSGNTSAVVTHLLCKNAGVNLLRNMCHGSLLQLPKTLKPQLVATEKNILPLLSVSAVILNAA